MDIRGTTIREFGCAVMLSSTIQPALGRASFYPSTFGSAKA
jgi:hypothetical protein